MACEKEEQIKTNVNNKQEKLNNFYDTYKMSLLKKERLSACYDDSIDFDNPQERLFLSLIKKIDNKRVNVWLELQSDSYIYLMVHTINHRRIYAKCLFYERSYDYEENGEYPIEKLYDVLEAIDWKQEIFCIKQMKFNKALHELVDYEVDDDILEFLGHELDDCCVCYQKINYKMKCNHYVCYDCYDQIEKVNGFPPCPMCRTPAKFR